MQNRMSETAKTFHGCFSVFVLLFYFNCAGTTGQNNTYNPKMHQKLKK